jgi:hypothetical protein
VFIRELTRSWTAIICVLMLTRVASAAPDVASIKAQIVGMPLGAIIELRLKDKQKLRGVRGAATDTGFTLVGTNAREHQVAFNDVESVKPVSTKSHMVRNILIGVGIGVGAAAIVLVSLFHSGGYI